MESEGDGVEVALGHDAGGVDEVLVLRAALDLAAVEVSGGAQGLEVGVDDGVGLGQQAGGFGGAVLRSTRATISAATRASIRSRE